MKNKPTDPAHILDNALQLADVCGWERLHLFDVAAALDIGLDDIARHYRDKDDLVEAWFDRADLANATVQAPSASVTWPCSAMPEIPICKV